VVAADSVDELRGNDIVKRLYLAGWREGAVAGFIRSRSRAFGFPAVFSSDSPQYGLIGNFAFDC